MIRALIVEDHPIVRTGIRSLLAQASDIEVVAEAATGEEGLRLALDCRPDVITLDISLPGMSGLEVLKRLQRQPCPAAVLILSLHPEDLYAPRLLRAGASGYLSKEAPAEVLISAIHEVYSGGRFLSPEMTEKLACSLDRESPGPRHEKLSNREVEVMRLLASGNTVTEIGHRLEISVKTVSTYRRRILEKMGIESTAEIVRYAVENRLIE